MTARVPVTVSHLELVGPTALRPSTASSDGAVLRRMQPPEAAAVAASMYRSVGGDWHWQDRLPWTAEDWASEIHRDGVEIWLLSDGAADVGYCELELLGDVVEIKYFGLTAAGMGRGLGGWLLTRSVQRAWELGAARVILNTCTLDGPAALPNYLARGFRLVRVEHQLRELRQ